MTDASHPLPSIERHPGFSLIRISGGPYERGLQHGRLLGDQIHRLREIFYSRVIDSNGRAGGLVLRGVMAPILLAMHRHISTELRQEMRGVARGAEVPYWDILTFNCFDDLLHSLTLIPLLLAKVPLVGSRFACSSFALLSSRTKDGRLLHGRNMDYEVTNEYMAGDGAVTRTLKEHVVVIECRPDRGHSFMSVGWPGVVGAVTSISEAGLSLACLTSTINGETPNGIPLPLLYRQVTQYAGDLASAETMIRRAKLTIGNNLLLASASEDDARVLELSPRSVVARQPVDGLIVTTNHFLHDETTPHQEGWVVPASLDRHVRLSTLCDDGPCDRERGTSFLRDTYSLAPDGDVWSCLENPGTIYSTLAEPAAGRLWVRGNDREDRPFVELEACWAKQASAVPA